MTDKQQLLYLCHRIPFPPNKGDKIRSYNQLRWLSERYDVFLGAFVDTDGDWRHVSRLQELCVQAKFLPLPSGIHKVTRIVSALFHRQPFTIALYQCNEMQSWVDSVMQRTELSAVLVFSSAMGQFVYGAKRAGTKLIVDFVDVDSEKWQEYSRRRRWPINYLYAREGRLLALCDQRLSRRADRSYFVSEAEATVFRKLNPYLTEKVAALRNGVDTDYFDSSREYPSPYPASSAILLFTGAMDYWPNIDAVTWFSKSILPLLRQTGLALRFYIVGAHPTKAVKRLAASDIIVTGGVNDIRPYLANADLVVAPLRVARGVQNKVLEAMAMGRIVVTTHAGAEGLDAAEGTHLWIHDDENSIASRIASVIESQDRNMGSAARDYILTHFRWSSCLQPLQQQIDAARPQSG